MLTDFVPLYLKMNPGKSLLPIKGGTSRGIQRTVYYRQICYLQSPLPEKQFDTWKFIAVYMDTGEVKLLQLFYIIYTTTYKLV
jgi:hypothetical protein